MEKAILNALAQAGRPVSIPELPGTKEDWGGDIHTVQQFMRVLIQRGKVQRHHSPDGILRYSLVGSVSHAAAPSSAPMPPRTEVTVRGKSADLLRLIGTTPQSSVELQQRSGLSGKEVSNLLTQLKAKGVVEGANGMGKRGTYTRAQHVAVIFGESHAVKHADRARDTSTSSASTPSTKRTATPPPAKKPRPLSERRRDFLAAAEQSQNVLKALEFNRDTARDALDLYVASAVDPTIYAGLKGAMEAAQTALDAFVAGGQS